MQQYTIFSADLTGISLPAHHPVAATSAYYYYYLRHSGTEQ